MTGTYKDGYLDGYQANARFHAWQAARAQRIATVWAHKNKANVQTLIRKHWPDLAQALDELEVHA